MKMVKVGIVSLGCARNLLDSEVIAGSLKKDGAIIADVEKGVDVCIVNTCAFVKPAREESIDAILELSQMKKEGRIKHLIVCGCLSQLYKGKLAGSLPEADFIVGTNDFPKIPRLVKRLKYPRDAARTQVSRNLNYIYDERSPRFLLTPRHSAYVKISEGCSNSCSYCIISRLRGKFRSRRIESVMSEIRRLSRSGALKEINLIGQDTTLFGKDIYGRPALADLLKKICALKNSVKWIRILYTHPAHYNGELIDIIRAEERICKYLDLPIQHISDRILKDMNRRTTGGEIERLIDRLRKNIPGLVLRTSVIVGFPGETDKEFDELLGFLKRVRFEKCGSFLYSREEGTRAAKMKKQVPEDVKMVRLDRLMKTQQRISSDINKTLIGRTVKVLIDAKYKERSFDSSSSCLDKARHESRAKPRDSSESQDEICVQISRTPVRRSLGEGGTNDVFLGRTQGDAPEVDGAVYVSGRNIIAGKFYNIRITDALEYDLIGEKI